MQYILVENKQIIHLGPIFWRHRFIQSELNDLDIDFQVSPVEPNEYLKISDTLEIYPISEIAIPQYDPMYEQLVGPYWTFDSNTAIGNYTITSRELTTIKNDLKSLTASERYRKEVGGVKINIQNIEVTVDTSRDGRNIFVQKYTLMSDTDVAQWKFPETWLTLTKSELGQIVMLGAAHIQSQFDWESNIVAQIDAATSIDDLKEISMIELHVNSGVV